MTESEIVKSICDEPGRNDHSNNDSGSIKKYHYLVTIKNNASRYTSIEDLDKTYSETISKIKSYELSDNKAYELDSKGKLHMHFIITIPYKQVYYKRFTKLGWTVNFKPFPFEDYPNVITYLNKVPQTKKNINKLVSSSKKKWS